MQGITYHDDGWTLQCIRKHLKDIGIHDIKEEVLNTKDHGIPQNRARWYCVGIRKGLATLNDTSTSSFQFPQPIQCTDIELLLDRDTLSWSDTYQPVGENAQANIQNAIERILEKGEDPDIETYIVDCDASRERSSYIKELSPCIICSRNQGHWITNRGRRMKINEMYRLQGMDPRRFKKIHEDTEVGRQLGNAMSVNVIERILIQILKIIPLHHTKTSFTDRWQTGEAIRKLQETVETVNVKYEMYQISPNTPNRVTAPVMASNPVAKINVSISYSRSASILLCPILVIGLECKSIKWTFSLLKVSK